MAQVNFYSGTNAEILAITEYVEGAIYVASDTGDTYIALSGNVHHLEPIQNTFSQVSDGTTTISPDARFDTLNVEAGENINLSLDDTNNKITISSTDTWDEMVGATDTTAGESGIVPAPSAGFVGRFLRADGSWEDPDNTGLALLYNQFVGATSSKNGEAGLVPTPPAGAEIKFLRGDATWQKPPAQVAVGATAPTDSNVVFWLDTSA